MTAPRRHPITKKSANIHIKLAKFVLGATIIHGGLGCVCIQMQVLSDEAVNS